MGGVHIFTFYREFLNAGCCTENSGDPKINKFVLIPADAVFYRK